MQPNILGKFLGQARITKLSEEDRLSCEGLITIEECVKALDTFEKGKSPDFFPPLVIKGNEFVYFNKGKHTSFASRVYENGHHGNRTYLRQGILLFKIGNQPSFRDTLHIKHTLLVWAWNNPTDWLRIDQAGTL